MIGNKDFYQDYLDSGGKKIPFSEFKAILGSFNKLAMREIIEHNKSLDIGSLIGSLQIIQKPRKLKKSKRTGQVYTGIDWFKSEEIKEEILARGGIPRLGDNGGEDWLVYKIEDQTTFFWNKMRKRRKEEVYHPLPNVGKFTFVPTRGNLRLVNIHRRENPDFKYSKSIQ